MHTGQRRRGPVSREEVVFAALLVFVPAAVFGGAFHLPGWARFFCSVVAVIPLAGFIGSATEALADRLGGRTGGLLNATFGNAPDLLVGVFGVQKGLIPLVKATLVGALISNTALIMGLCCIAAGLRHGRPRFNRSEAGNHSVLMLLALAAVAFPSVGAAACASSVCAGPHATALVDASVGIAVALLLGYLAYVAFSIFGLERLGVPVDDEGAEARAFARRSAHAHPWPPAVSLAVLVIATLLLLPVVDVLTTTVQAATAVLGWTDVFVGIVIVANAGNVAEAYAAIRMALSRPARPDSADSGLDLALGIASASSIQIAAFVAPLVVLYSLTQHAMDLAFSLVEVAILALVTMLFNYIAHDGESNWLEGFQLLVMYAMAAVVFYTLPVSVFGG